MRVVIADDSLVIREGLARLLAEAGCDIIGTAADASGLRREVQLGHPDAAIVDIRMPPTFSDEGLRAAHDLRRSSPHLGILVFSQYVESEYALRLIRDAPEHVGYLLKDRVSDVAVVVDALRRVVEGECVVDPTIASRLLRRSTKQNAISVLSPREQEVLTLMAEGRSNSAMADRLAMSSKTIEAHIHTIFLKLGLPPSPDDHRRVLAVLAYLRPPR